MPTVLIVEDDDSLRYAAERHLSALGMNVLAVADSMSALQVLDGDRGGTVNVLLADIVMPEGTPHGIALALMAKRRWPTLKVIYMTGYQNLVKEVGTAVDGMVFSKPLNMDDLATEIRRLCPN